MVVGRRSFPFGPGNFSGALAVKLREGTSLKSTAACLIMWRCIDQTVEPQTKKFRLQNPKRCCCGFSGFPWLVFLFVKDADGKSDPKTYSPKFYGEFNSAEFNATIRKKSTKTNPRFSRQKQKSPRQLEHRGWFDQLLHHMNHRRFGLGKSQSKSP